MRVPPLQIGEAQLVLRLGMPLLGRPAIPDDRVAEIAEHAFAAAVKQPEPVLRFRITGAGETRQLWGRVQVIFSRVGGERRLQRPRHG